MENLNLSGQNVEQNGFTKTDNKAKLWQLLQRNGAFNDVDSNYFNKVREEFEINVVKIQTQYGNRSVMDRNKLFLDMMIEIMNKFKNQPIYTAADIQKSKRDAFENDLSQKQAEFNKFNAKPKPPEVNFTDKEEDSGDVNAMLEQVIRDREDVGFSHPPPLKTDESSIEKPTTNTNTNILNEILQKLNRIEELVLKQVNN